MVGRLGSQQLIPGLRLDAWEGGPGGLRLPFQLLMQLVSCLMSVSLGNAEISVSLVK